MAAIDLGAPLRGGKDGYLQNYFMTRQTFAQMLSNIHGIDDPRISLYTDFLISSVTDAESREDLYSKKQYYYENNLEALNDSEPGEKEKASALAQACMQVLGDVTSWYDEFLAITHTQTFGICGVQPGEEEEEASYDAGC